MIRSKIIAALALLTVANCALLDAQPRPSVVRLPDGPQIAWFGTWKAGLAEAKRTGRPILLVSAAPHCNAVPGVW